MPVEARDFLRSSRPLRLDVGVLPRDVRILVLAPHPDDFDETGIALRRFSERGAMIELYVLSSSANGVEDSFCVPPTDEAKAAVREEEQRRSCLFFGLPDNALRFFRLPVGAGGYLIDDDSSFETIRKAVSRHCPDIVFLPHGNDSNPDHRLVHRWWSFLHAGASISASAFLFRDPKTIDLRVDAFAPFSEEEAAWKAELLRFHRSQHVRNLRTRGNGFDDRILSINRESARRLKIVEPYAEAFELSTD
jgi:LmbE family N-acetylglucosaminyl deacetylase